MTEQVVERIVDAENQIWYAKKDSTTQIGFTNQFLNVVREAWHVVPANTRGQVKAKSPLMAIETNDALLTIFSPSAGSIVTFNKKAQDFPDQLTEDDVVVTIDEKAPPAKKAKTAAADLRDVQPVRPAGLRDEMVNRLANIANRQFIIQPPPMQWEAQWRPAAQVIADDWLANVAEEPAEPVEAPRNEAQEGELDF